MSSTDYRYSLSITSQFYYCGIPLRLDAYSRCQFNCSYCFANARGGNRPDPAMQFASVSKFEKRLNRVKGGKIFSAVDEMLSKRIPIHFGGMSDPFPPLEGTSRVSLGLLKVLAANEYPTIVSTKSALPNSKDYLDVLSRGNFIVQASLNSLNSGLLKKTDCGTPGPVALLEMLKNMSDSGIPTACRIQPLLPSYENDAFGVISACAEVGVKHVAVEHLKLPVETRWRGTSELSRNLGFDVAEYFRRNGAKCTGREWILPVELRVDRMLAFRDFAVRAGLSFGSADNDLLHLSDGRCCCSGIDMMDRSLNFFRFNYTEAVRNADSSGKIAFDSIRSIWSPERSIGQFVNSNSRIAAGTGPGKGVRDYVQKSWNSAIGNSPASFYGVKPTSEVDHDGKRIYQLDSNVRNLMRTNNQSEYEGKK